MLARIMSHRRWRVIISAIFCAMAALPFGCNKADTPNEAVQQAVTEDGALAIENAAGSDSTKPPAAGDEQQSAAKSNGKLPGLKFKLQEVKVEGL